jgi:hypothetical protein
MAAAANQLALVGFAAMFWLASPAMALDPRYPDWPCPQLKVPGISPATVWNGPSLEPVDKQLLADPRDAELVTRLVARRTQMEEARKLIEEFIGRSEAERQVRATALFAELYSVLNAQRDEVMNGIERFSRKEKDMAAEIRAKTRKMQQMQDESDADPAATDPLATQLAWETRIFEDRQRSMSYVCEVPVLIEKRLFDLGKIIQEVANFDASAK